MKQFLSAAAFSLFFIFCSEGFAQIQPARIFSDNMVLQRDIKIPVWGTAAPGEVVTVLLGEKTVSGATDKSGKWKIFLPGCNAGGPFDLKITGSSDTVIFRNILVGDVWFASGQSNMEHPVKGWEWIPHSEVENFEAELQDTKYPEIRLFNVPKFPSPVEQENLMGGEWKTASAESVAGFSAIGWFFAKKINAGLNIPIGIIHASWGGTAIRTWLDRESLELFSDSVDLPPVPQNFNPEEWEKTAAVSIEKHRVRRNQISYPKKGLAEQITMSGYDDSAWTEIGFPFEKNSNVAWLRKKIVIPEKIVSQPLQLSLGFLNRQSQVFFNGTELGYFQYPEPVKAEIPRELIKPGKNVLTIRLAQPFGSVQTIGEKEQFFMANTDGSFYISLEEGWKINSGLEPVNAAEESFQNNPAFLFNGMVAPVIPYGIKGFIWFQGESDAGRPFLYEKMFQQLITDWRRRWQLGNLPFLFIQVSNIELSHRFEDFDDSRCLIRLAQQKALELPNTGMVVSADIGDPYDVHPKNKKEFADRLVAQAEKKIYGKKVISDGPLAKSFQVKGNTIIVKLNSEGRLIIKGKEDLNGFEIAGADSQYYPAKIRLKGSRIFISSPNVKNPTAARYAWRNNPNCSLYNAAGLPAAPFSTLFLKKKK